jgi:hypothetical protein
MRPRCGVRLKSGTTGRAGRDAQPRPCQRKMAARSAISYTEVIHRQCCESSLATNLEASMRTGVWWELVMDGGGEEMGVWWVSGGYLKFSPLAAGK